MNIRNQERIKHPPRSTSKPFQVSLIPDFLIIFALKRTTWPIAPPSDSVSSATSVVKILALRRLESNPPRSLTSLRAIVSFAG